MSKSHPGSTRDFTVFKGEKRPLKKSRGYVAGYQGIVDIHPHAYFPYKASKNKPLDRKKEEYTTSLSRIQGKIEPIFVQLKTFKILSDLYRHKCRCHSIKFNIIAGIVNLKSGFT